MAWYDNEGTSQTASYDSERSADRDLREAVKFAWSIKDASGAFGQLAVGPLLTKVAAAAGVGIIFGSKGPGGNFSLNWQRDPATAQVINEENRVQRFKADYDQAGNQLNNNIKKVADMQTRSKEGPRTADAAKSLADGLEDRSRNAVRRKEASERLAEAIDGLMAAYTKAGEKAQLSLDLSGRLRAEAAELGGNAAQDELASGALRAFANVAKEVEEAAKTAQDAARQVAGAIMRIADAERRVLTARDDAAKDRAERDRTERQAEQQQEEERRTAAETERSAKEAQREQLRAGLPVIPLY